MEKIKIAVAGCGFWSNYQVAAWKEFENVEIVAAYNRNADKAHDFQKRFNIPHIYEDVETMLQASKPDVLDIVTANSTHADFVRLGARHKVATICQKPLTSSWEESKEIVALCQKQQVPLYVHENWRFQTPMRKVKALLSGESVGDVFRARITCSHAFPVFENQPALKELKEMAIADLGVHLLDTARYLFGEAEYLYAQVSSITPGIKGEDVATILLTMKNGCRCIIEVSFTTKQEIPHFPQTTMHIEGSKGVISVKEHYKISLITSNGVEVIDASPRMFPWANPDYAVVHSSIYDCNKNLLAGIAGEAEAETTGTDNLETLRLTYAAYESAKSNRVIHLKDFN